MSAEFVEAVESGSMTAREAAVAAQRVRNQLLEPLRDRSSSLGKAIAEWMKTNGRTMDELLVKYSQKLFKTSPSQLSASQLDDVYLEITKAAGRDKAQVSKWASRFGKAGRALVFVSIGIVIYNIATAEDKRRAAAKEGVTLLGGIAGGAAAGAAAGLACGPGAPICSGVGVVVGGVLGAIGVDLAFDELWPTAPEPKVLVVEEKSVSEPLPSMIKLVPREAPIPRYTVQAGDSLASIAARVYGDQNRWMLIYRANSEQITHPKKWVHAGQILLIPVPGANHGAARKRWGEWYEKTYGRNATDYAPVR
jgi:hypothetical protein